MSKVVVSGIAHLKGQLRRYGQSVKGAASDEVATAAINIQRDAKRAAPVDMSRLRSSIAWEFEGASQLTAVVGSNVAYAPFVEFGTGPAGRNSNHSTFAEQAMAELGYEHGPHGGFPPLAELEQWCRRHGIPEEAAFPIALAIRKNGTPARPYLTPAIEAERREFPGRLTAAIGRVTKRAGR
jgi:HK97 gp10 family phage protein